VLSDLHSGHSRTFIVVDDDADDRDLLHEALSLAEPPLHIIELPDGIHLMEHLAKSEPPALIILDLNMPHKSGMECLAEMRAGRFRSIPVVVLSTSTRRKDVEHAYQHGASFFFSKPCTCKELNALAAYIVSLQWQLGPVRVPRHEFDRLAHRFSQSSAIHF
jgi:CheY-like chemotaxis protein